MWIPANHEPIEDVNIFYVTPIIKPEDLNEDDTHSAYLTKKR